MTGNPPTVDTTILDLCDTVLRRKSIRQQTDRGFLRALSREYSAVADPPFIISEVTDSGSEELLSPEVLEQRLEFWRGIELEQQMASDLESGFIASPDEFIPHDEEWT